MSSFDVITLMGSIAFTVMCVNTLAYAASHIRWGTPIAHHGLLICIFTLAPVAGALGVLRFLLWQLDAIDVRTVSQLNSAVAFALLGAQLGGLLRVHRG